MPTTHDNRQVDKFIHSYRAKQLCWRGKNWYWGSQFCLSVRLSVTRVLFDETKERTADTLIPHERVITLVFCRICGQIDPPPLKNAYFDQLSAYNVSTVRASEKVHLSLI